MKEVYRKSYKYIRDDINDENVRLRLRLRLKLEVKVCKGLKA